MRYTAKNIAACMEVAMWRCMFNSVKIDSYHSTTRACRKLAKKSGIPWKKIMNSFPSNAAGLRAVKKNFMPELWEKVAHPMLLVDEMMSE